MTIGDYLWKVTRLLFWIGGVFGSFHSLDNMEGWHKLVLIVPIFGMCHQIYKILIKNK